MQELVPLSIIKDNPYRNKKRNPIDPERVEALAESMDTTAEFWVGVYGRKVEGGFVEIAFGHHRVDAARLRKLREVPIEIRELSDGEMLMRMARENIGRGEQPILQEAISSAVKALAEGKIELEEIDPNTRKSVLRCAPSFIPGVPNTTVVLDHAYTVDSLARFLGYVKASSKTARDSFVAALGVLELEERKLLTDQNTIKGLGTRQVLQLVSDIKQREVKTKERTERTRREESAVVAEQIRLEAERKAQDKKAKQEYEASIRQEAEARREENKKEVERLKKDREEKAVAQREKEAGDILKKEALKSKLKSLKKEQEEAKKEDQYAPIRREVESLVFKLETDPSYSEETKSLSRKTLRPEDRERIRQAALKRGSWFSEYFADMFLPPLSQTKKMTDYRSREEAKRRAVETTTKKGKKR